MLKRKNTEQERKKLHKLKCFIHRIKITKFLTTTTRWKLWKKYILARKKCKLNSAKA